MKRLYDLLLIREDEPPRVIYLLGIFLLIGMGMAIGRSSADALFLKRYGVEYLPVMYLLLSVLLALVSTVYAAFADRMSPESFFRILFTTLTVLVTALWTVMTFTAVEIVYPLYFLVYEVSSELLLVHGAHYLGQNLNTLQAKRLSPLILAGAQSGIIAGGVLVALLAPRMRVQNVLLVWCVLLLLGMVIMQHWHRREGASSYFRPARRTTHQFAAAVSQVGHGLRFTRDSALLRSASFALFFMVIAFYILSYSVNRFYTGVFTTEASLTTFFGVLTAITSTLALLIQIFVTGRAIKRFGVRRMNLLFPMTTLVSLLGLLFHYALPTALAGSLNKDTLMPAFRGPVRTMFYNILPNYMQGRARAVSVVVVLPLALLCCGLLLWLMQRLQAPAWFLVPGVVAALLYYYFNTRMNRDYVRTLVTNLRDQLYLSGDGLSAALFGNDETVFREIVRGVNDTDEEVCLAFARLLVRVFPGRAAPVILARTREVSTATVDRLVRLLVPLGDPAVTARLGAMMDTRDPHLLATLLRGLIDAGEERGSERIGGFLHSPNPRLRAVAVHGIMRCPFAEHHGEGMKVWRALLTGAENERLAALDNIADLDHLPAQDRGELLSLYHEAAAHLATHRDAAIRLRAFTRLSAFAKPFPDTFADALSVAQSSESPPLREAAAGCVHLVAPGRREPFVTRALDDGHMGVRKAVIAALQSVENDYVAQASRRIIENHGTPRSQQALLDSLMKLDLPNPLFESIALEKSRDACRLKSALERLDDSSTARHEALQLLKLTLGERLQATINLALRALEPLYDSGVVATIREGIASGDARHVANAIEALHSLDDRRVTPWLLDALGGDTIAHKTGTDHEFRTLGEVLDWCRARQDDWLRHCAGSVPAVPASGARDA